MYGKLLKGFRAVPASADRRFARKDIIARRVSPQTAPGGCYCVSYPLLRDSEKNISSME